MAPSTAGDTILVSEASGNSENFYLAASIPLE
jgi:hypothetical protein